MVVESESDESLNSSEESSESGDKSRHGKRKGEYNT